jgi:hypothetical protein
MVLRNLPECFPDWPSWPRSPRWPRVRFPLMRVSVSGKDDYFTHVVSTASFANLRTIDIGGVPTTYKQRQAIRTLRYGPAVKVGIKFKTRWWEQGGISQCGDSSYTDRQSRVVVYPSYGLDEEGPGVLMVTYNWCAGSPSPSHSTDTHNAKLTVSPGIKTLPILVPSSRALIGPNSLTQTVNARCRSRSSLTRSTETLPRCTARG